MIFYTHSITPSGHSGRTDVERIECVAEGSPNDKRVSGTELMSAYTAVEKQLTPFITADSSDVSGKYTSTVSSVYNMHA